MSIAYISRTKYEYELANTKQYDYKRMTITITVLSFENIGYKDYKYTLQSTTRDLLQFTRVILIYYLNTIYWDRNVAIVSEILAHTHGVRSLFVEFSVALINT